MAEKKLHLRVQNPNLTLDVLASSTLKELLETISKEANTSWDRLQLIDRSSFPPKPLSANPYLTLSQLSIENQTTFSVKKLDQAQNYDQYKAQQNNNNNNNNDNNNNTHNKPKSNENNNNSNQNDEKEEKKSDNSNNNNNNKKGSPQLHGTLIRYKIADDNSCLFNSIQMCCDETHKLDKERTKELREMVASIILSDSDTYNKATLDNKSNNEYAQWIMQDNSWGGEIELSILSDALELIIVTIDIETLKLLTYGKNKEYKKTIYLLYSGIHYDSVIMEYFENNGNTKYYYQFDSQDDSILAQALSLAQEMNKKKEFTNVYKFALMCIDCGQGIIGQNEAVDHAKETGHTNFQEYKKQ